MKKILPVLLASAFAIAVTACTDASVASHNISQASDQFEITRRVVFYNGITGKYMLAIEGRCSLQNVGKHRGDYVAVVCKLKDGKFVKNYLGLSDNVTYFAEQIRPSDPSVDHYRVIFKPSAIIPNVDVE